MDVTEDITKNEVTWTPNGVTAERELYVLARSPDEAKLKPGVPREGYSLYVNKMGQILNPFLIATQVRARTKTPSKPGAVSLYIISASYGVPGSGNGSKPPKPDGPAVPHWKTIKERVPTDVALENPENLDSPRNVPIAYANGDVADPPLTMLTWRAELTLQWVAKAFGYLQWMHLLTSINKVPFFDAPALHAQLTDLDEAQREDGYLNCSMTVEVYQRAIDLKGTLLDVEAGAIFVYDHYFIREWNIPVPGVT